MNSPLPYIGGKSKLAQTIIDLMPAHKIYCEVFAGAGWVFFKKQPSKYETINDLDSDLVAFYRVLQNHLEEFLKQFKWLLCSREWFEDWKRQLDTGGLTDIQRAARYYYVQRQCFAGRVRGRTYGTGPDHYPRINLLRMEEELSAIHIRLARVKIENLQWPDLVRRYDRQETLFFCDPPYFNAPYYRHNFEMRDYVALASALQAVSGKFILTINDVPEMREVFGGFRVSPVTLKYSASVGKQRTGKELIVKNF